jgi:hypothetical protein
MIQRAYASWSAKTKFIANMLREVHDDFLGGIDRTQRDACTGAFRRWATARRKRSGRRGSGTAARGSDGYRPAT